MTFSGTKRTEVDGPFPESKWLIAGFRIVELHLIDEAVEWIKKRPSATTPKSRSDRSARPDDFGEAFTPESRAQESRQRAQLDKQNAPPATEPRREG